MATTTIDAVYQGAVRNEVSGAIINWLSQVRNAATGNYVNTYTVATSNFSAIISSLDTARAGYAGVCGRTFLFFNNFGAGVAGNITAATLKVYNPSTSRTTDTRAIESTAWGSDGSTSTLSASDFSNIDHSTAYSSGLLSYAGGYNNYTLNATAIADMNTNGYLNTAVIESDYDYDGDGPTVGTVQNAPVRFLDATNKIKLELTYSTGYGNKVIGVDKTNIGEVTGVATANIGKVIGVQ
jgi:hypothetical protein